MCDVDGVEVEETSEHLVGVDLEFEAGYLSLVFVFLEGLVEVAGEVVHHHVQVLLLVLVGEEAVTDLEGVWVVQAFQDLQLSVLVFFVLVNLLDSHHFQRLFVADLMNDSKSSISNLVLELIAIGSNKGLVFLVLPVLAVVQGDGGMLLLVVEDLVDGDSVGLGEDVFVLHLGVELGGVLLEGDRFDRLDFLQSERLAFVIAFLGLEEGLAWARRVVKTDFLGILVGLGPDPTGRFLPNRADLDFQVANHLNDHYYIPKPSDQTKYHNQMETPGSNLSQNIQYLKCSKGGLHEDENLNIVCLEKTCLEKLINCCACIEEDHKKHLTKPLKMVIKETQAQNAEVQSVSINVDIMMDILNQNRRKTDEMFQNYKIEILELIQESERALRTYFDHTSDQILLKNSDSNLLMDQALHRASQPTSFLDLRLTVKKIVSLYSSSKENNSNISEEQLKLSLSCSNQNIQSFMKSSFEESKVSLGKIPHNLTQFIVQDRLWQVNYKFNNKFKHADIKIVSDTRVKAVNSQGYKFAVMEPGVESLTKKTFSFLIRESKTNWVAVGFCNRKTVSAKGYSFTFGSIGHGAYMISSNGGSWSNHKASQNNSIKGIKYTKGDTVHATVDSQLSTITFKKNSAAETYSLQYQLINKEEICPCVLFYYKDDEIEYLPNGKQ